MRPLRGFMFGVALALTSKDGSSNRAVDSAMGTRTRITPILALVFGVIGLAIGEVLKLWQDDLSPLVSAGLTVAGGTLPLIVDYLKDSGGHQDSQASRPRAEYPGYRYQPYHPYQEPYRPPPPHSSGKWLLVALLVVIVIGGGAAYGISYGISYATGNETVQAERLVAPASGTALGVTVSVEKVDVTAHYIKVRLTATNRNRQTATLPLFGNCQLIDGSGTILKPGSLFGGLDPIDVPPNGTPISATITFRGKLSPAATTLSLGFNTVFGILSPDERSLQVNGIKLKPQK
jgi:hypothetical protein